MGIIIPSYSGDIVVQAEHIVRQHFAIVPRRDLLTGEIIWFKKCYKITQDRLKVVGVMAMVRVIETFYTSPANYTYIMLRKA